MAVRNEPVAGCPWLLFVGGAPGAGKSSVVEALLAERDEIPVANALVIDADWLLEPASALAGHDLTEAADLWPAYGGVWMRVLEMVARNGASVVLFTPARPSTLSPIRWPANVGWCLLDCDDTTRVARLRGRGWTPEAIEEAIADARALRDEVSFVIDTSRSGPEDAARRLAEWVEARLAER